MFIAMVCSDVHCDTFVWIFFSHYWTWFSWSLFVSSESSWSFGDSKDGRRCWMNRIRILCRVTGILRNCTSIVCFETRATSFWPHMYVKDKDYAKSEVKGQNFGLLIARTCLKISNTNIVQKNRNALWRITSYYSFPHSCCHGCLQ